MNLNDKMTEVCDMGSTYMIPKESENESIASGQLDQKISISKKDEFPIVNNDVSLLKDVPGIQTQESHVTDITAQTDKRSNIQLLLELKQRKENLLNEIKNFGFQIKPKEFESYSEYFIIHNFERGRSVSGQVDINMLRRKEHGIYYKRIKPNFENSPSPIPSLSSSNNLSDSNAINNHDLDKLNKDNEHAGAKSSYPEETLSSSNITTRSSTIQSTQSAAITTTPNVNGKDELRDSNLINGDISLKSIIPISASDGSRRRSSRISKKEQTNLNDDEFTKYGFKSENGGEGPQIHDLFESLVPKIDSPYRRSDWILQAKQRYIPEKQLHTKPEYEVVKMNELVTAERIQTILLKFEGGVAGVRKKG